MNYTLLLNPDQINNLIFKYHEYELDSNNNYTLFRAKIKYSTLSIYQTGKILIQGKDAYLLYKEICEDLSIDMKANVQDDMSALSEPEIPKYNQEDNEIELFHSSIGNDEVGTGDFFGPIVVCSAYVSEDTYMKVRRLKVKDSKQLSDKQIIEIAKELITFLPHEVTILNNSKYNEVIKRESMNLNRIKAILHNNVMNKIINNNPSLKDEEIILDDFCGKDKYFEYLSKSKNVITNIKFETKAENKYLSVASASIIARFYFLAELDKLSEFIGFKLIKGASNQVDKLASEIIKTKGTLNLSKVAKLNFKNYQKAIKIINLQNSR